MEVQEVTQRSVGYSWNVSVEVEHRQSTAAKYPDKRVTKVSFGGHTESKETAFNECDLASKKAKELAGRDE